MIGQTVSHYRILSKLGEGGMGTVYLAEDNHLTRRVAIKFLNANSADHHYRARFLREARAISSLSHPNIATVYDYGETADGQPFLVMELVQGETLGEMLDASALTLARAVEIIEDVAEALEEAHHYGIVHRDIKPSNVIVTDRELVKVLDFGLAKRINEENYQATDQNAQTLLATHTRDGVVVGTPLYLSPEQATGAQVDGRSDLFALGALLYECISGKPAFSGSSVIEIGAQVLHIDPRPPSEVNPQVPPELDRITLKALAKKPADRYQTAREMMEDLAAVYPLLSEDEERIARIKPPRGAGHRTSALITISHSLRQPRFSLFSLVAALLALGLAGAILWWVFKPQSYQAPAEAQHFYDVGVNFLREGAYYQASKSLEKAISIDDGFALAHARLAEAWRELDYADKAKDELLRVNQLVPNRSSLPELDALYLEAINDIVSYKFAHAADVYQKIVDETGKPEAYVDLGRAYEKNEEIDKALKSYREATIKGPEYATAFLRTAIVYLRKRDYDTAQLTLNKAASLYEALGNVEGRTEVLYQRGVLQTNTSKFADARQTLEQALDLTGTTGNESQRINILLQLSRIAYLTGDTDKASQIANDALQFAESRGLNNLAIIALLDLGNAYNGQNRYDKSEDIFRRALELAQRNKARRLEAQSKQNLGSALMQQLKLDEGLPLVEQALVFFQEGNYQKQISSCLTYIGRAHRLKGNYAEAFKAFQRKLEMGESSRDQRDIASADGDIATLLAKQERYPEALKEYTDSYAMNKSLGDRLGMAYNQMNKSSVLWHLGRYDDALADLKEAEDLASKNRYQAVLAETPMIQAQIALSQRRFADAKQLSQTALERAGTLYPDIAIGAKITLGLAQTYSGAALDGRRMCEAALEMARRAGDEALISDAMLALAQALYESDDADGALRQALEASERLARLGEQESAWRAYLIAARSSLRKGNQGDARVQVQRANDSLTKLEQLWGAEDFNRYQSREDIKFFRKQLSEALPAEH